MPRLFRGVRCRVVAIHSKPVIVDDEFLPGVGQLFHRSMGFDTECNLAIEAGNQPQRHTVIAGFGGIDRSANISASSRAGLRRRCSGVAPDTSHQCLTRRGAQSGERLFHRSRHPGIAPGATTRRSGASHGNGEVLGTIAPVPETTSVGSKIIRWICVGGNGRLLALLWRWMPLDDWLHASGVMTQLQAMSRSPAGFIAVLGGYVLGGLVALPITLLIVLTLLACGPWLGMSAALLGSLLSAATLFGVGRAVDAITFNDLPVAALRT